MPFVAWNNEYTTLTPWRMVLLCLGILTLRRLPGMYALQWWIPDIKTRREALFAGHFGPMGVGAIFIVSHLAPSFSGWRLMKCQRDCSLLSPLRNYLLLRFLPPTISKSCRSFAFPSLIVSFYHRFSVSEQIPLRIFRSLDEY